MQSRFGKHNRKRNGRRQRKLRLESLEVRSYLHGDPFDNDEHLVGDPALPDAFVPADVGDASPGGPSAATYPLSSVPILNSFVGAAVSIYLDFVGHFDAVWGSYSNINTPVFDVDGDASTFSDSELATIYNVWQAVSEDYAPYNVNVTTVNPGSFNNGQALLVAIGGNGAWLGAQAGGVAYVDSFTNSIVNTAFVFSQNLANYAKYIADATSHEAGHAFGLQHQSKYSGGSLVDEYYEGPGNGTAPIMGNSYYAARSLWWNGTSTSSSTIQDDMSVIAKSANGFGYRTDDHGNSAGTATALTNTNLQLSGSGIISKTTDVDYFSFETGAGQITLSVDVAAYNNLDARLELRSDTGTLITFAAPTNSFGATITTTVAAGFYRLVVVSGGGYGNVGQYTVSGTVLTPSTVVNAPQNLTSSVSGGVVHLSWADMAGNETTYYVDRSDDGNSWTTIATLGANSVTYNDAAVTAGATYYYRVWAEGAVETSGFSNVRTVSLPPLAVTNLVATAASTSQINLSWNDAGGETGYLVQRSNTGSSTWTQIAVLGADATSYQSTGLSANKGYTYRIVATNSGGGSPFSNFASATTLPIPPAPVASTGLNATVVSTSRVDLTWSDNASNETGFRIQRYTGGSWKQIAEVGADVTSYSDTAALANKTYKYRVRAFNEGGNSGYSNTVAVTTPPVVAPTALTGSAVSSAQVNLSWTDNNSSELGFRIERATGSSWKQIAEVGADVTSFSDLTALANKSYKYRVRAFDAGGNSVYTNSLSLKTPVVIAPTTSTATPVAANQVDVTWVDNGGDESGFRIERATGSGSWKQIAEVGADVTSFSDLTVVANKTYKYRVRAFNSGGTSAYTNTATATTPITASLPSSSLALGAAAANQITTGPRTALFASHAVIAHGELVPAIFGDRHWVDLLLASHGA